MISPSDFNRAVQNVFSNCVAPPVVSTKNRFRLQVYIFSYDQPFVEGNPRLTRTRVGPLIGTAHDHDYVILSIFVLELVKDNRGLFNPFVFLFGFTTCIA